MKLINSLFKTISALVITSLLFSVGALTTTAQVTDNNSCNDPNYQAMFSPIYRQWNNDLVDHFYTNSSTETAIGYSGEKSFGSLINSQRLSTVPLYRYWSSSATDHFYSTSADTPAGYVNEGIIGYIFVSQVPGSMPLYRAYRQFDGNGDHLYTSSSTELDSATQYGYHMEGIEGYVCAVPQ